MTNAHRAAYARALGRVLELTPDQLQALARNETAEQAKDRLLADCITVPCAVLEQLDALKETA